MLIGTVRPGLALSCSLRLFCCARSWRAWRPVGSSACTPGEACATRSLRREPFPPCWNIPLRDGRPEGAENVNAQVDDLITTGLLRRVLAFTELKFSNS